MTRSPSGKTAADQGFTLIEVVVAMALLGLVASAAGIFMVQAVHSNRTLQDTHASVQVARQVLERVKAVPATQTSSTLSALVHGRSRPDVQTAWNDVAADGIDISDTYTGAGATSYDQHTYEFDAGSSVSPVVPLTGTTQIDGKDYDFRTLIGTCTRERSGGECDKSGAGDELFRVVVVVDWEVGPDASPRQYVLSTLIDPADQPSFNAGRRPYAYDDEIDAVAGEELPIPVLLNDKGSWPINGAVSITDNPTWGSAALDGGSNDILYTANANYTGDDTLEYNAVDTNSIATDKATVTIRVFPGANDDVVASSAKTTTVPVLGNDTGALGSATVTIVDQPAGATATVSGTNVMITADTPAPAEYQATYTVTAHGRTSKPATVTVNLTPPAEPTASDANATGNAGQQLSVPLNVSGSNVTLSSPTPGVAFSGTTLRYTPASEGTVSIPFTVTDDWGRTASATVTAQVAPAVPLTLADVSLSGSRKSIDLAAEGLARGGSGSYTFSVDTYSDRGWRGQAGTEGNTLQLWISPWSSGTFTWELRVTDSAGATASSTVTYRK